MTSEPWGVHAKAGGVDVAIPSAASAIEFCVFDAEERETRFRLPERTGEVHHGHIPGIALGTRYGLRADTAPAKLLLDPWAVQLDRIPRLHPAMLGEGDTAPVMPKGVVAAPTVVDALPCLTPWAETVIYELHVRGFTMCHPDVPPALRGTFAGLAHPAAIAHLVGLGITAVELMPPNAWIEERHLAALGLTNYWGYNTIAPLAPDPRLAPGGWAEVRAAVAALAAAGIETIIDMVPNHSGEGDARGPTLSLRGLDDAGFYRRDAAGRYIDDTGCGNTVALDRPAPLRLAMDSLRAWVRFGGVHGFRFDLATTMGRRAEGFDAHAPLLAAIGQDPLLAPRKLIAEPWDIGPGGYQLGRFPPVWGEWNDRFRDDIRRFWRGEGGMRGALATRLSGSADAFAVKRPSRSVNFVVAHDGFTLADLVSHERKHNHANGEANRDGTDANHSWNHGVEGPTDDPLIAAARLGDQRALLATLLLARGTPMLAMGSESGQSQGGNNNAYAQDNESAWLDWAGADAGLLAWVRKLLAQRRAHPALREDRFLSGGPAGDPDVQWLSLDGQPLADAAWAEGDGLVMLLDSRLAVAINRGAAWRLMLPGAWRVLACSADPEAGVTVRHYDIPLAARSVMLLERADGGPTGALLDRLALAAGIAPEWWEVDGTRHDVSPETKRHLLAAMRLPAATQAQARESLAWIEEQRRHPATIVRRGGADPIGRHRISEGGRAIDLIVAPPACYAPPEGRRFGISAQLYTLRRPDDAGIGDFTTLRALVEATAAAGGAAVALNPLHALFPADRRRASPYHPSDRRFIDPIYLDVGEAAPALAALPDVDYPRVWAHKLAVLRRRYAALPPGQPGLDAFIAAGGVALRQFTAFETGGDPAEMRFTAWLQMLADAQLAAASRGLEIGLIRDLAVGAAPDGAEAAACVDILAQKVSIGAPPDPFSAEGQIWGLPPPDPNRMQAGGYAAFSALLQANMRHAGGLRIDHVMGLSRLFWVPEGAAGRDGAYVRYPFDDLLGVLALESHAARAIVIGEDLGTVPEGFRERLAAENILGCRVLLLEREGQGFRPAADYPVCAAASVSTHDLSTLAGWRAGADIAERAGLGLRHDSPAARMADVAALDAIAGPEPHGFVAGSPACLVFAQADDLAGEARAVNLPGTDTERPNWRRRLVPDVAGLFAGGARVLDAMRPGRTRAIAKLSSGC